MRKKLRKILLATTIITAMAGTTVFADDVTDLTNKKNAAENELTQMESEYAYLLIQIDELEVAMAEKNDEIESVNRDLEEAQKDLDQQMSDMSLRIRYIYEDQTSSIMDAFLTASSMSDALNKAEYLQQLYNYDKSKCDVMAETAAKIKSLKEKLEKDKEELQSMGNEISEKQALLYTSIAEQQSKIGDITEQLVAAQEAAAAARAAEEEARKNSSISVGVTSPSIPSYTPAYSGNSGAASVVVNTAYSCMGVPYVWGGSTMNGFDCSGLVMYCYKQAGISVPRSSGSLAASGAYVGSLSEAQPGDVICYPGHVAVYIGGGQVIHAPYEGQTVKIASANMMGITAIRRYW